MTTSLDPTALPFARAYALLTSVVVPRPIAWVSSLSEAGVPNLAPHSYFNLMSAAPPVLHFTSTGVKDSLRNVRATGEFVVNLVDADLLEQMNLTAADFPPEEDEFSWAGIDQVASEVVAPARVAAAPAALECRVRHELRIDDSHMVFGDVVRVHLSDAIAEDGVVDPARFHAVGRLGGQNYSLVDDLTSLQRPRFADVRDDGPRRPT